MNATEPLSNAGGGRRVLVSALIATATAAVTAGVALNVRNAQAPAVAGADAGTMAPITATPTDPSLPAASEVLKGVPAATGEPSPTF